MPSGLHLGFLHWWKQLILNPFSLLHRQFRVFPGFRVPGQDGSGTYLPPNMDNDFFSFPFAPLQPQLLYHHSNIRVFILFSPINMYEAHPTNSMSKKYTILYFIKLNFYLNTHVSHRGSRKLKLSPIHNFLSQCGALREPWNTAVGPHQTSSISPHR